MTSYAMLGFDGGKAYDIADNPIHFQIDDMQIAEDLQVVSGHIIMKFLKENIGTVRARKIMGKALIIGSNSFFWFKFR